MPNVEDLFQGEPEEWLATLPAYQQDPFNELRGTGRSLDEIAQLWVTATAENTFRFGAAGTVGDKTGFIKNLKKELRAFLCGDSRYEKEREGLFGSASASRQFVVGAISIAIAPYLSVAAAVLAPIIAILLASFGKITLNAWCAATEDW